MNRDYDHIKEYIAEDVENDVRLLVSDFAILWNNYEKYLFSDYNGNPSYRYSKIINKDENKMCIIDRVLKNMNPDYEKEIMNLYDGFMTFFKKRYGDFSIEKFIYEYKVRNNDILNNDLSNLINHPNLKNNYLFLMLMVGRVRNNMFHGIKVVKELNYQKELFEICNKLLTLSLDITNTLVL